MKIHVVYLILPLQIRNLFYIMVYFHLKIKLTLIIRLFVISRKVKNTSEFKINTELLITNQNVFFSTVFLFSFIKTIIILCQKIFLSSG